MMNTLWQDIRFGFRMMYKIPGFTAVVVVTLALGIGANTALFSVIDAAILKMLPVQNPEELVELGKGEGTSFSYPIFEQIQEHNTVFSEMLTVSKTPLHITDGNGSESVEGQYVSGNFFTKLGIQAIVGRTIIPQDDQIGESVDPQIAVISFGLWQSKYGGDSSVTGKTIEVEHKPFTIIGVTPPEFFGLQAGSNPGFWVPMSAEPVLRKETWLNRIGFNWLSVLGRIKPGVTTENARINLEGIISNLILAETESMRGQEQYAAKVQQLLQSNKISVAHASNGLSQLRHQFSTPLFILMSIVGVVLLIACLNIANILLSRAESRRKEFAVRLSIGAGSFRLLRQVLVESVLLSLIGGFAGLFFAVWFCDLLIQLILVNGTPIELALKPDVRVLSFTVCISILTGLLFGILPAFHAIQMNIGASLKNNSHSLVGGRAGVSLNKLLIISQIAITLVLLYGAVLFVGSFRNLKTLDPGFNSKNVLLARVNAEKTGLKEKELQQFYHQLLNRVNEMPTVNFASISWHALISRPSVDLTASIAGYTSQPNEDMTVYVHQVSPDYFNTMSVSLLQGRDFGKQDSTETTKTALINETMAKRYFSADNPIGRQVRLGDGEPLEIIGVVSDVKDVKLRGQTFPTVFTNCFQEDKPFNAITLAVRTEGSPYGFISAIKNEIASLSSSVSVSGFNTLANQVDKTLTQEKLVSTLSGFFGGLALLLACIGLYGVMSYNVSRRANEIGIRMAIGAQKRDMIWMVLQESLLLAATGIMLGIPITLIIARFFASQISGLLFELSPMDARIITLSVLLLICVSLLAGYIPARRAAKVDPMTALRCE